jgi:hypothetical protein
MNLRTQRRSRNFFGLAPDPAPVPAPAKWCDSTGSATLEKILKGIQYIQKRREQKIILLKMLDFKFLSPSPSKILFQNRHGIFDSVLFSNLHL